MQLECSGHESNFSSLYFQQSGVLCMSKILWEEVSTPSVENSLKISHCHCLGMKAHTTGLLEQSFQHLCHLHCHPATNSNPFPCDMFFSPSGCSSLVHPSARLKYHPQCSYLVLPHCFLGSDFFLSLAASRKRL